MYACPQCARSFENTRFADGRETCPVCGAEVRQNDDRPWVDVARVTNLAEAGFLTDELVGLGIDAQIHQLNDFSALTDCWASLYLIRVPAGAARDAAARIRQHLADVDDIDAEGDAEPTGFGFTTGEHAIDPLLWRPVALVILAGVSSFVLGQRFSEQQAMKADRRPPRDSLSSAVQEIDRPFVAESAGGQPGHRLQFDERRQSWILDTDRDGDGRYDSRQAFHATGASW
jgi:hypothetical protein